MAAPRKTFAARMQAGSKSSKVESWDDDNDFEGDIFSHSIASALHSSRALATARSESNFTEDDWQAVVLPDDNASRLKAISSAEKLGVPIPANVPASALLGGSIKRLGKKKSTRQVVDDDWGSDLQLPANMNGGLKLKPPVPRTPAEDLDDLDDWGEGSLGIRFAGRRGRDSSVSAMSPSVGSCITESDDDLGGLVLPTEPLDFNARLEKLKRSEHGTPNVSPLPPRHGTTAPSTSGPTSTPPFVFPSPSIDSPTSPPSSLQVQPFSQVKPKTPEEDDFLDGLDFGNVEALDTKKLTLNRNVVVKPGSGKVVTPPAARPATTIHFIGRPVQDKPAISRIPRPLPTANRTRLAPLYENTTAAGSNNRSAPTTTNAQLLRAKRSAPALRNKHGTVSRTTAPLVPPAPSVPSVPTGSSNAKPHRGLPKSSSQIHLRRDSDPRRPLSPAMRPYSRMSTATPVETPSRMSKRELAPSAMARHPQRILQPKGPKRDWGIGDELEAFDELPISASKEKQFEKAPRNISSNRSLRQQPSVPRMPVPDRMTTPLPHTPQSPIKQDTTPRFARDTAASRNAREQRLAGIRSRGEGPIVPTGINWKAHVAARSPHASPTSHKRKGTGQKPQLIQGLFQPYAKTEKGMIYNPITQVWEGNEVALVPFTQPNASTTTLALTTASTPTFAVPNNGFAPTHDRSHSASHAALSNIHGNQRSFSSRAAKNQSAPIPAPVPSPPRPALISQRTAPRGIQYEGQMVFDPVRMTWLKAPRSAKDPRSPPIDMDDDDDPFAGLDDLKDNESVATHGGSGFGGNSTPNLEDPTFVGEEFDLGPSFIRRQREEEALWRQKTEGWVGLMRDNGEYKNGGWRWAIRNIALSAAAASAERV